MEQKFVYQKAIASYSLKLYEKHIQNASKVTAARKSKKGIEKWENVCYNNYKYYRKAVVWLGYISKEDLITDTASTCCFTGHRRRDLPFDGNVQKQGVKNLISTIQLACVKAYEDGYRTFLTGMAEGADILCGSVIMDMMGDKRFAGIKLICVLPYAEQKKELRSAEERYIYSLLINSAEAVVVTGEISDRGRYRERNRFMIEHSSALIAVYREKLRGSGTLQTINMAKKAGLKMHIIELDKNPQFYID